MPLNDLYPNATRTQIIDKINDLLEQERVEGGEGGGGATNLTYTTATRVLASSSGDDVTLPLATTALPGLMDAVDKTKLDGVATGATANSADATLLARANHTGTQAASTISDFASAARAQVEAELVAGTNVTITPSGSGASRQLTIAATGGGGGGATNLSYTASTRVLASDTGTDATLPLVSSTDAGLAPATGGGTANFLRADGTWAAPPGGGGGSGYTVYDTAALVLASSEAARGAGTYWQTKEGHTYLEAASSATNHHVTTAPGGVKLYVLPDAQGALNVKAFGAKGDNSTDDRAAIQNAIDCAIYKPPTANADRIVFFPAGRYVCGDTIHAGYGVAASGHVAINLRGVGMRYDTNKPGTQIRFTHTTGPGIVFQGGRLCGIEEMTVQGAYGYIEAQELGYLVNDLDHLEATWKDPGAAAAMFSRYSPYTGISIDPYSGTAPSLYDPSSPIDYPNVTVPSYAGGPAAQYGKLVSSGVRISNVVIRGFVIGLGRTSTAESNGEFIQWDGGMIWGCHAGVSFGHSQVRNIGLTEVNFEQCFTAIDLVNYGTGHGRATGTYLNCHFGGCYHLVKGQGGWTDSLVLRNCYGEYNARLGELMETGNNSPLVLDGCVFHFREIVSEKYGVPQTHMAANYARLVIVNGTSFWTRSGFVIEGANSSSVVIRDSRSRLFEYETGSIPLQFNQGTGGFLMYGIVDIEASNNQLYALGNQSANEPNWAYKPYFMDRISVREPYGGKARGAVMDFPKPRLHEIAISGHAVTTSNRSGRQLELGGGRTIYENYSYADIKLDLGDAVCLAGVWFRVSGFNGSNAVLTQLTAYRQNKLDTNYTNQGTTDGAGIILTGWIINRVFAPAVAGVLAGTMTSGSAVITNVKNAFEDGNAWTVNGNAGGSTLAAGDILLLSDATRELLNIGGATLSSRFPISALDMTAKTITGTGTAPIDKSPIFLPWAVKVFTP